MASGPVVTLSRAGKLRPITTEDSARDIVSSSRGAMDSFEVAVAERSLLDEAVYCPVRIGVKTGNVPVGVDGEWLGCLAPGARNRNAVAGRVPAKAQHRAASVGIDADDDATVVHPKRLCEAAIADVEDGYGSGT